jgi:hypothetical protein
MCEDVNQQLAPKKFQLESEHFYQAQAGVLDGGGFLKAVF